MLADQHLDNPAEIAQEHAQRERHRGHHQKGQPKRSAGRPCVLWPGYGVEMLRPRQGHWYAKRAAKYPEPAPACEQGWCYQKRETDEQKQRLFHVIRWPVVGLGALRLACTTAGWHGQPFCLMASRLELSFLCRVMPTGYGFAVICVL